MVMKFIAGLAISVGAGVALQANSRSNQRGVCRPAKAGEPMIPVTIRVHTAASRATDAIKEEFFRTEAATAGEKHHTAAETRELENRLASERSAELAEIRMMVESLDRRNGEMMTGVNQRIDELQNDLPRFIDVKVTSRIREAEDRLRSEFQDEQSKTLDAFLQTLESKVLPRLTVVEQAVGSQGQEIGAMRMRMDSTEEAINRVVHRIERMVDSLAPMVPEYASQHVMEIVQKAVN